MRAFSVEAARTNLGKGFVDHPAVCIDGQSRDTMNIKEAVTILLQVGCTVEGGEKPGQFLVDGKQFTADEVVALALKIRQEQAN